MAAKLPFYKLTKTELLQELETTNKYIKERLTDQKFNKYIQTHTPQSNILTNKCKYLNIEELHEFINRSKKNQPTHIGNTQTNVVHFNIRSLDKHFSELLSFHEQTKHIFDYTGLSEIGKKNLESRKAFLQTMGYDLHYKESHLSKGGAGLITKLDTEHRVRHDLVFENKKYKKVNLVTESIWLEREFADKKRNFIIGAVYRHPGSTVECLEEFTQQLSSIIKKIENERKKVYIVGDLNIDGMKVTENKKVEQFFNMLMENNYIPLITKPTRVQDKSISLIDHVIINPKVIKTESKIKSGVIYSGITDHLPVFMSIQETHKIIPTERPMIRIFSEKNMNTFYRAIENCSWDKFGQTNNVSEALKIFYDKWKTCHDKAFPLTKLSRKKTKNKPWINAELASAIRQKNDLYKVTLLNPSAENKKKLAKVRNKLTNRIRREHGNYYQEIINSEKQNLKKLWDIFGKVINAKKMRDRHKIRELKSGNKSITNDKDIANSLNNFFCGIGQELATKHNNDYELFKKYLGPTTHESIELIPTTETEVFDLIGILKKKASGSDQINPRLLVHCRRVLAPILAHLYNLSFQKSEYPDLLKIAKVIPIFKKSNEEERQDPGNYRPISLLSALNKLLEKIIYKRLINFIDKNNILYRYQFGFRRRHSTTLALMDVVDNIRDNLNAGKKVAGVYIDFSKAFDCVNHHILLKKLDHYGIRGNMKQLIESYLTGRKQYTVANGVESETKEVKCGVPQGSVLGPLLFLLYTNDLQNCTDVVLKLFADDTNGFIFEDDYKTLKSKIKMLLINLFKWSAANKLTINVTKTCYTIFHNIKSLIPKSLNSIKIKPKDKQVTIKREKQSKYLGLYLDELLNWDYQIANTEEGMLPKLTKLNNSFKMIKHYAPVKNRMLLFTAYFQSKLNYGLELIGSADHSLIKKLQVKQNRALKILFNKDYYTPTKQLHYELKTLMVTDEYKLSMAKFVYKQQHGLLPVVYDKHYTKVQETHGHTTRQKDLLKIGNHSHKSQHSEKMSAVTGAKIWNDLPEEVRQAKSLYIFKNACKAHFLNMYQPQT